MPYRKLKRNPRADRALIVIWHFSVALAGVYGVIDIPTVHVEIGALAGFLWGSLLILSGTVGGIAALLRMPGVQAIAVVMQAVGAVTQAVALSINGGAPHAAIGLASSAVLMLAFSLHLRRPTVEQQLTRVMQDLREEG